MLTYIREYREAGYLPEAMFNFLALLGWSYSPNTDLFTREQAIAAFELHDINVSSGALPLSKLEWMNGIYIRGLTVPDLSERLLPFLSPATWREVFARAMRMSDGQIRFLGLSSMLIGLLLLLLFWR